MSDPQSSRLNTWPAMIDLLAATLLVFLVVTYIQDLMSIEELEAMLIKQQQIALYETLQQEFADELQRKVMSIKPVPAALNITFHDGLLFGSGKYNLKENGQRLIVRLRRLLAKDTTRFELVQVEGHTDDEAVRSNTYPSSNWQLSAARAITVVELLAARDAIDPQQLSANGYADFRPIASNETEAGRKQNRRIELRILFDGQVSEQSPNRSAARS